MLGDNATDDHSTGVAPTGVAPTGVAPTGVAPTGVHPVDGRASGLFDRLPGLRPLAVAVLAIAAVVHAAAAEPGGGPPPAGFDAPEGFIAPPLHPAGITLETRALGQGVYALVANHIAVDNSGFIVGARGVLVVDAHINGAMARQIQAAVRRVTAKPILYLVNTNYHGDHTFGNYAFPAETRIIAQRRTAALMAYFERNKSFMMATVNNDPSVFADVELRLPDLVFDDRLTVDLGGRVVEVYHFGRGNTPGDTVVYEPATKVAWTGNLVVGEGTIPPIFEGDAGAYLATIAGLRRSLDIATIVPGHGSLTDGATINRYLAYLGALIDATRRHSGAGRSLAETLTALPLDRFHPLPAEIRQSAVGRFLAGLHRLNVQQAYLDLNRR